MLNKLKSFVIELSSKKAALWIIDVLLMFFICYAYFTLKGRSADRRDDRYILFEEGYEVRNPGMGPEELLWRIEQNLAEAGQKLLNEEEFPSLDAKMPVLVVLAGRRPARLQHLLASLADVADIGDALLVVSHSFYDDAVNELVRRVDYCRVLQLYYPYSIQLFPDRFPGADADRPRSVAAAAEHKHHWWWTAHFLFDHYTWIDSKFTGLAIFLQEDDYVAPDLLHMLKYGQRGFMYHPEAEVVALGRPVGSDADYGLLTVAPWQPPFESGLAFNRTFWQKLNAYATEFCQYNDASWSYSLLAVFTAQPCGYVDMIASMASRVLTTRGYASGAEGAAAARALFSKAPMYPTRVRTAFVATDDGRVVQPETLPAGAGGWADSRDVRLCLDPFLMTTRDPPLTGTTPQERILKLPGT